MRHSQKSVTDSITRIANTNIIRMEIYSKELLPISTNR